MKYQPKHMREQNADSKPILKGADRDSMTPDSMSNESSPSEVTPSERTGQELPTTAHPLGIPIPDPGDGGEYVPIPGRGSVEQIAPNGAVIRNPWSEQPEIKPDYAYTDEQDDMNLLIM